MNILFDFDGTISDSLEANLKIINEFLSDHNYQTTSKEEIRENSGLAGLIKSRGISLIHLPGFIKHGRKKMAEVIPSLKIFPNLAAVLQQLAQKHTLGIITSNSETNVKQFLKNNNLSDIFEIIDSSLSLSEKHKEILKNISKHKLVPQETIYVGDETRDIKAAQKAGITSGAVTWGHESLDSLKKSQPDYIFNNPKDLLRLIS